MRYVLKVADPLSDHGVDKTPDISGIALCRGAGRYAVSRIGSLIVGTNTIEINGVAGKVDVFIGG